MGTKTTEGYRLNQILYKIIHSPNKISLPHPAKELQSEYSFGEGEMGDFMSFGFAFVEHQDHMVEYIVSTPKVMKQIIAEMDVDLSVEQPYIATLWTAKLYVTDKVKEDHVLFGNADQSVVLDLNLNKKEFHSADL